MEDGQLFLSIVVIGNGGGSGEGTESVFVLRNGKWELVGCYYFTPDIYGNR
ncbi:MAG: hypothetical protein LBG59_03210 [Candidatus Peribacteria bacterium]|nr:hypothetical protein [Candidatus Peribacteria bacterium]